MTKFLEQPEKQEPPVVAMARQALGRVKEMELTPEQHEKIINMIDQAKEYEAQKKLSKALNIYNQVLSLMKDIKSTETELVEYGDCKVLSQQAAFLHLIEERSVEGGIGIDDDFGKRFELSLAQKEIKDNLVVDDKGNIISLKLPHLYLWSELSFSVLKKLGKLAVSDMLDAEEQDRILSQLPNSCEVTFGGDDSNT